MRIQRTSPTTHFNAGSQRSLALPSRNITSNRTAAAPTEKRNERSFLRPEVIKMSTPTEIIRRVSRWLERVESATGKKPIIYTHSYWWNERVGASGSLRGFTSWISDFSSKSLGREAPIVPEHLTWSFWQITDQSPIKRFSPEAGSARKSTQPRIVAPKAISKHSLLSVKFAFLAIVQTHAA